MLEMRIVRRRSLETAKELGYAVNASMPLIDWPMRFRSQDEIIDRALSLYPVVAVAHGSDSEVALKWLDREELLAALTLRERSYLHVPSNREVAAFRAQEESLWALVWMLGFIQTMDFSRYCQPILASLFPSLQSEESTEKFRARAVLRPIEEIVTALDLAYCIHWAIRSDLAEVTRGRIANVEPYVVIERRRALEWVCSEENWDSIQLDT